MPENEVKSERWTTKQKFGLGILSFLGIAALILGFLQFIHNVRAPFAGRGQGENFKTQEQKELNELLALQSRDTDQDGISDFDEIHLYKTSPYLEDSDSDGYSDKQEIDSGNNPNCPVGKNCMITETRAPEGGSGLETTMPDVNLGLIQGQATPEEIRETLRQAGMSDEALSEIDDQTLMEVYQETLKETPLPEELNVNAGGTPLGSESLDLNNLSADEIRDLLRQAGVEQEVLQSLDDETLRQIFEESIE